MNLMPVESGAAHQAFGRHSHLFHDVDDFADRPVRHFFLQLAGQVHEVFWKRGIMQGIVGTRAGGWTA